ncbi:MAG: hypothetical protein ACK40O_09455 [Allosphingosinicella sp.]
MKPFLSVAFLVAASAAAAAPAAAEPWIAGTDRSAFAGATIRLELGGARRAAPEARLGIGLHHTQRSASGAWLGSQVSPLALSFGVADRRLEFFPGGAALPQAKRRLGLAGESTPWLVAGGVAAGVLAIVLLTGDDDEKDGPCPPGVEVCAF